MVIQNDGYYFCLRDEKKGCKVCNIKEKYHNFEEKLNENRKNKRYLICYGFELFADVVECVKHKRNTMDIFYDKYKYKSRDSYTAETSKVWLSQMIEHEDKTEKRK